MFDVIVVQNRLSDFYLIWTLKFTFGLKNMCKASLSLITSSNLNSTSSSILRLNLLLKIRPLVSLKHLLKYCNLSRLDCPVIHLFIYLFIFWSIFELITCLSVVSRSRSIMLVDSVNLAVATFVESVLTAIVVFSF